MVKQPGNLAKTRLYHLIIRLGVGSPPSAGSSESFDTKAQPWTTLDKLLSGSFHPLVFFSSIYSITSNPYQTSVLHPGV